MLFHILFMVSLFFIVMGAISCFSKNPIVGVEGTALGLILLIFTVLEVY